MFVNIFINTVIYCPMALNIGLHTEKGKLEIIYRFIVLDNQIQRALETVAGEIRIIDDEAASSDMTYKLRVRDGQW